MTSTEKHFLHTIKELISLVTEDEGEYSFLKLSGLLRKLLIDSPSLIDKVNQNYKQKIIFKTSKRLSYEEEKGKNQIVVAQLSRGKDEHTVGYNKHSFLALSVLMYKDEVYSVKDIIKLSANVLGGVHYGDAKEEREKRLIELNEMLKVNDNIPTCVFLIGSIALVTADALKPLILKILATLTEEDKQSL